MCLFGTIETHQDLQELTSSITFLLNPENSKLMHTLCVLFDFQFFHFISSPICIAMHFVLVKMPRNSMLLTNNLLKRGDMESLVRSSVSPSSQVKVKLKLTAFR